jgi:hypothetical protein
MEGIGEKRERNKSNQSFSTYPWQWWVIFTNSTKYEVGGAPLRQSMKSMDLEPDPLFLCSG